MTSPYPQPPPRATEVLSLARDAIAVALMLIGVVLAVVVLFTIDVRAGWLTVAVLMVTLGVALGYRRTPR